MKLFLVVAAASFVTILLIGRLLARRSEDRETGPERHDTDEIRDLVSQTEIATDR